MTIYRPIFFILICCYLLSCKKTEQNSVLPAKISDTTKAPGGPTTPITPSDPNMGVNGNSWIYHSEGYSYGSNFYNSIVNDPEGNLYRYFRYNGVHCLVKQDVKGNIKWTKKINGNFSMDHGALNVDKDGNTFCTLTMTEGDRITIGSFIYTAKTEHCAALIKFNTMGDVVWLREIGGLSFYNKGVTLQDVTTDPEGNVYVAGCGFSTTLNFVNSSKNVLPDSVLGTIPFYSTTFWAKYNNNGDLLDAKFVLPRYGTIYNYIKEFAEAIAVDNEQNIFVWATGQGGGVSDDGVTFNKRNFISYITKYDKTGKRLWMRSFDDSPGDMTIASHLLTDAKGDVYISGRAPFENCELVKLSSSGRELWRRIIKTDTKQPETFACIDNRSEILVGANVLATETVYGASDNNAGVQLTKFSSDGTQLYQRRIRTTFGGVVKGYGAAIDHNGYINIHGKFTGAIVMLNTPADPSTPIFDASALSFVAHIPEKQ